MSEHKIVHARVYNPAGRTLFKTKANDKSECEVVSCSNQDNCALYKRGECAMLALMNARSCPYGKRTFEYGPTKRASKLYKWVSEREEKYKDYLWKLTQYKRKLAVIGEYVFLPYSHMNMNKDIPFASHGHFLSSGSHFITLNEFTPELILKMISFRPQALMGGEITSYQKEEVPKFVTHLREELPEIFAKVVALDPAVEKIAFRSPIGRKAILESLRPGVVVTKYHDNPKLNTQHWTWDGEYLTSTDAGISFSIVKYESCEIKIKPAPGETVDIINMDQVDENTKYAD